MLLFIFTFFGIMSKILSVVDSMNATKDFVRPIREGEQVLESGLIVSVGLKERKDSVLHIQALVLRTSGLTTQHPYLVEVWVNLKEEYGSRLLKDQSLECECPAGQSEKCKYVVAVLLYLTRLVLLLKCLVILFSLLSTDFTIRKVYL